VTPGRRGAPLLGCAYVGRELLAVMPAVACTLPLAAVTLVATRSAISDG
jgi:hypothetical protein